jgi:hypothetical protein
MFPEIVAGRAMGVKREYRATGRGIIIRNLPMPLRVRLIALIGLVLLVSLAGDSALVGWHAANSVRTELRAALMSVPGRSAMGSVNSAARMTWQVRREL